ncbi:MAG: DUF721 domain-containing protein [Candidatus Rifleibacteriota bacterium]
MAGRKTTTATKTGKTLPVGSNLLKVLGGIREKNFQASPESQRFCLTAREMLMLGRLKFSWKDIVGIQLAHKTCPERLIRGRLYLTVSDSQWLHTLVFVKGKIIEKLKERFPELQIVDLVGRPGRIPVEVEKLVSESEWPEWEEKENLPIPDAIDKDLGEQINRCYKHLIARNEGLLKRGYRVCVRCRSGLTTAENQVCALCVSVERSEQILPVRNLLKEMPWLDYDEILAFESTVKSYEFEAVKADLVAESLDLVKELAINLKENLNEEILVQMKKEMVRAIMLVTGDMPDQVDLFHLSPDQIIDPEWLELLSINTEGEAC